MILVAATARVVLVVVVVGIAVAFVDDIHNVDDSGSDDRGFCCLQQNVDLTKRWKKWEFLEKNMKNKMQWW